MFQLLGVPGAQAPKPSPSSPPETSPHLQLKLSFYHSFSPILYHNSNLANIKYLSTFGTKKVSPCHLRIFRKRFSFYKTHPKPLTFLSFLSLFAREDSPSQPQRKMLFFNAARKRNLRCLLRNAIFDNFYMTVMCLKLCHLKCLLQAHYFDFYYHIESFFICIYLHFFSPTSHSISVNPFGAVTGDRNLQI
jgi:hypothetical protein